jgi:hypothetical protein
MTSSTSGSAGSPPPKATDQLSERPRRSASAGSLKIEQILEERATLTLPAVVLASGRAIIVISIALVSARRRIALTPVRCLCRPLENLVQLAAIQPDAAALGAVVDLDALSLGDAQFASVNGTVHQSLSLDRSIDLGLASKLQTVDLAMIAK